MNPGKYEAKRLEKAVNGEWVWIVNNTKTGMCISRKLSQQEAESIVVACNSHDNLIAMLRKFVVTHEQSTAEHSDGEEAAYVAARSAIYDATA